ncbi:MAG TPA: DUF222 domain-containing protein [Streptosporangiaceae bacterium]|nr:DUF222 domain-containing protein [Streptosporangiaceae bacterium]
MAEGLSWSWTLDVEKLVAALSEPAPWHRPAPAGASPEVVAGVTEFPGAEFAGAEFAGADPVEAEFADYLDAMDAGRTSVVSLPVAAGRIAEILPPSPDLAAWLACNPADGLEDVALAGTAAAYRRLAAWAQAGELAVVAQMASRSAAADKKNKVDEDGRPDKVTANAYGQVSLALTLSQSGAQWWTDLAVGLRWRLKATGAALREGVIDLARAKAIVEATEPLDDDKAKVVEGKVLPKAGEQTTGQLRAALRRAVIAADPEGAEKRREEAEKRARVTLYPDAEGTASLAGHNLPGVHAAAAMARMTALARALKASGVTGGIDLLRSKVLLGLLLGTLPHIPPPPSGPVDADCPPGSGPGGGAQPGCGNPLLDDWPWPGDPAPASGGSKSSPDQPAPRQHDSPAQGRAARTDGGAGADGGAGMGCAPLGEDGHPGGYEPDGPAGGYCSRDDVLSDDVLSDDGTGRRNLPWPEATTFLPPGPAVLKNLPPAGSGFLDLTLPWDTLARGGPGPGSLTRLGSVTPAQASYLALLASQDPGIDWRVVLISDTGQAVAITRVRRARASAETARAGPANPSSLLHRVTVIMPACELATAGSSVLRAGGGVGKLLAAIVAVARQALDQATERAAADAAAGGCAHSQASLAYQVPSGLREFVNIRDLTCRFPTCRQPAWRCDCDHSQPFDQNGQTCSCNLGSLCRYHHQLKQLVGWDLDQPAPGTFIWTTPVGRKYIVRPDQQAA